MLKINFSETRTEEKWVLHGQLSAPWVQELRTCWKKNHRTDVQRACIVDLNEITLVDKSGERVLRVLLKEGAQFIASGVYTKHIIGQLKAERKRRIPNSLACLLGALLLALIGGLSGCGQGTASAAPPAPPNVQVVTVPQKDVPVQGQWVGTLQGYVNAQIQPQVNGYLIRQTYDEGSFVRKGQVLFEIDPRPFQAALDQAKGHLAQAQAQMANAQINVDRDIPEAQAHAIPQSQLDNDTQALRGAKAAVETDQAAVETAALNLGYTKVVSLIDGIVGITSVQVGNLVGPSTILTSVSQVDPIKVYFPISEREYLRMADGGTPGRVDWLSHASHIPLELVLADGTTYLYRGRIVFADRQVNTQTGTIQIVGEFPNPKRLLRPGEYAQIRALTEVLKGALLVPQAAVTQLQGSYQVDVVDSHNQVQIRNVEVGPMHGTDWVIEAGLKAGEQVVVVGTDKVRQGEAVSPSPYSGMKGE